MATEHETRDGPWKDRPERQHFFEEDAVIAMVTVLTVPKRVTIEVPCRVERVHPPEGFTGITGPASRGWLPEQEVTREQFIRAERGAGFRPKYGGDGLATGGFSTGTIRGRIQYAAPASEG